MTTDVVYDIQWDTFRHTMLLMSPAARLAWIVDLYAPLGFRKDGRRVRKGIIDRATLVKLVNAT